MNSNPLNEEYAELCAYSNMHYTPAWYWKRFLGFFNVECYRILANWEGGVPDDDILPVSEEEETGEIQSDLKRRKIEELSSK